jgi:hypothetical protein
MGIKKKCRELNRAKNKFVAWLKERKAEDIDIFEGGDAKNEWDYYRAISAFVGNTLYNVYFMMWKGEIHINYSDEENRYEDMSIEEFYQLFD